MDNETIEAVDASMQAIASAFKERRRQGLPSHGGATSFPFFDECLAREAQKLRGIGQVQLGDAIAGLLKAEDA